MTEDADFAMAWGPVKKRVEVGLHEKNAHIPSATGVGDPFKDTTSVALNPILQFSTLFGLPAVEIAFKRKPPATAADTVGFGARGAPRS